MRSFIVFVAVLLSVPASAQVTLQVSASGQLTGATGVDVGGTFYDVEFRDGTCAAIFGDCDDSSDFAFSTFTDALAAGQALLDQVFIDGSAGQFDTDYGLTFGCDATEQNVCAALIPYGVGPTPPVAATVNGGGGSTDAVVLPGPAPAGFDSTAEGSDYFLWAQFTLAAPQGPSTVPEPASWAMMLLGFGAAGLAMRRSRPRFAATA